MKKGFTLVELLGVIMIISIISAIAIIAIDNNIKKGKETTCKAQELTIIEAAKTWQIDNNDEKTSVSIETLINQGYLDVDFKNPMTGDSYSQDTYVEITISGNNKKNYTYKIVYGDGDIGCESNHQDDQTEPDEETPTVYAYHTGTKTIGSSTITDGVSDYTQLNTYQNGKTYFLQYELDENNVIQKAWACQTFGILDDPICLQGGTENGENPSNFYSYGNEGGNWAILNDLHENNSSFAGSICNMGTYTSSCTINTGESAGADSVGIVYASSYNVGSCTIDLSGDAYCN